MIAVGDFKLNNGYKPIPQVREPKIVLEPVRHTLRRVAVAVLVGAVFVSSVSLLSLDWARFVSRLVNLPTVMGQFMQFNPAVVGQGLQMLWVSVWVAVAGLAVGAVVSVVLAFLAAANTQFFTPLAVGIKGFVSVIRAVPNLVLILMIVASMGMGYIAGVVALSLSSIGYLTKAFIASIEAQDAHLAEALQAGGASWLQVVWHGYLPSVATGFLAWVAINLESNISSSISLGIVGAGGIGMLISRAIRQSHHGDLSTYVVLIFAFLFLLEMAVTYVRRRLD